MQPDRSGRLALCVDMLGRKATGNHRRSQRYSDYDLLVKRSAANLPEESFQWYLDLRAIRQRAAFGIWEGLERTVRDFRAEHIREVILSGMLYRVISLGP